MLRHFVDTALESESRKPRKDWQSPDTTTTQCEVFGHTPFDVAVVHRTICGFLNPFGNVVGNARCNHEARWVSR